jgi:pimeloyl-ACP methyl ester carboxylesterase
MMGISDRLCISLWVALASGTLLMFSGNALAGQYVRVSPDLDIYYEEAGSGTPIIFIPGWIATSAVFNQQLAYFSKNYRAISYDPRSVGRSSKTLGNNNYTQHGADLKAFIDTLLLEDVVLVGWSLGCADAYAYFRIYGTENVKAFVCIDKPPKSIIEQETDWGSKNFPSDFKAFNEGINHNRLKFHSDGVPTMVMRTMTQDELHKFVDEGMKTPTYVAIALWLDGNLANYTQEAKMIASKIPVLYVLSEKAGWTEKAKAWLTKNVPNFEIEAFGYHAMFWEFPDRFNALVDDFLRNIE